MTLPDSEVFNSLVAAVFRIEEVTLGNPKQGFHLRYRGQLLLDSAEAYDRLAAGLKPYQITPLFRLEDGRQTILLVREMAAPQPGRVAVNIAMFVLTVLSVLFTGAVFSYQGPLPESELGQILALIAHLWVGWPFAVSLLAILLAHEFGHYFVGRRAGAAVSLPYFLPLPYPFSPLGTLGAFIRLKDLPRNRRALFDLGIAGPLAGLAVAVPVLILGLALSPVETIRETSYTRTSETEVVCPTTVPVGGTYTCTIDDWIEGNSPLYLGLKYLLKGRLLPAPVSYDLPAPLYWLRYLLTGGPIPLGGQDVMLHPVAWAGWAGLLVTFLNLVPAGQLDGGHILYAVFGKRVRKAWAVILGLTLLLGFFWTGWWLWSALIYLFGRRQAEPLDQITQLDPKRKALAWLMLVVFLLVLTPVPLLTF